MAFILDVLGDALDEIASFGPELREIIALTLVVSLTATAIGLVLGVPFGLWLGGARPRGRSVMLVAVNVGMGIPPVLAGLFVLYLLVGFGHFLLAIWPLLKVAILVGALIFVLQKIGIWGKPKPPGGGAC